MQKTFGLLLLFAFLPMFAQAQLQSITSPRGIFDKVYDRFGKEYALDSLRIDTTLSPNTAMKTTLLSCTVGNYFHLYFEDGSGMENVGNATEDARRAVVCQVFEDLAQFITPANANTPVNIWVRNITQTGVPSGVLGLASSFYIYPAGAGAQGILDGAIWQTIQSGHDAYTNVVSPLASQNQQVGSTFYHGMMAFDFTNYNWQTDLTTPIANIPGGPNGNIDLYSVVLHEITHTLGFASLIFQDGTSKLATAGTNDAYYSRYDKFLRKGNTTIPILTDGTSCGDMYNFAYNATAGLPASSVITPNPSIINCATAPLDMSATLNCADAIWYKGTISQPVYTPYCYQVGSSLSHFEDMCHVTITGAADPKNDNEYYAMSNANGTGPLFAKRFLRPEERQVLCDLGYHLATWYGGSTNQTYCNYNVSPWNTLSCAGLYVAGTNDGLSNSGTYQYFVTMGGSSLSIPIAAIIGNDAPNVNGLECVESVLPNMINTLSVAGGNITLTSGSSQGLALLRYIPIHTTAGGTITRGNITYIYVWIQGDCPPTACTNMVNNGGFENSSHCGDLVWEVPEPKINCWSELVSSPDLFTSNCSTNSSWGGGTVFSIPTTTSFPSTGTWYNNANNQHFIGLSATANFFGNSWEEAIQNSLNSPILQGQTYQLTFRAKASQGGAGGFSGIPNGIISVLGSSNTLATIPYQTFDQGTFVGQGIVELVPTITIPNDQQWHTINLTFIHNSISPSVPVINNLILANAAYAYGGGIVSTYLYIDDVSLMPIASVVSLDNLLDEVCTAAHVELSQYVSPPQSNPNNYFEILDPNGALAPATLNGTVFSPNAAGIYTVIYYYFDALGCKIPISETINVVDNCPDIEILKTIDNQNPTIGNTVTYTIQINNIGTLDAHNIHAEDIIPPCIDFQTVTFTQGAGAYNPTTGLINIPFIAGGDAVILEITAIFNCGDCPNTCGLLYVEEGDGNVSNNSSTVGTNGLTLLTGNLNSLTDPLISGTSTSGYTHYYLDGTYTIDLSSPITNPYTMDFIVITMAPGAEIIVPNGAGLSATACTFKGCTKMWKGISVADNAFLRLRSCTVQDAQYGVKAEPNANMIDITGKSYFYDNYIGVFMNGTAAGQSINHNIQYCTFACITPSTSNPFVTQLMPPYPGQTPALPNIPTTYSGIYSNWIATTVSSCTFNNLNMGIYSNKGDLIVTASSFENIHYLPGGNIFYNPQFYTGPDGSAIYIMGNAFYPRTLKLTGLGNKPSSPVSFQRCDKGVYARMADVIANKNRMTMMAKGFEMSYCKNRNIFIDHNRIHAYYKGIEVDHCSTPLSHISIDHNYIEAGKNLPFLWYQGYGIDITEVGASYPLAIHNDTIFVNNAISGLNINGKKGGDIYCNIIYPTNQIMGSGIQFQAADNLNFHNNEISGLIANVATAYTDGLRASLSQNNRYLDNTWTNTRYGMNFSGTCNGSSLKGNQFYTHKVGLRLSNSAILGEQGNATQGIRYGNKWVGLFTFRGAQHEADLTGTGNPATVAFVHQSEIFYSTTANNYYPNPVPAPLYWFEFKAGSTYTPSAVNCAAFIVQDKGSDISETDRAIAANDLDPLEYPEETKWMLRRDLYERIADNDTLLQDSLMAVFYANYDNSNFADFYAAKEGIRNLDGISESEAIQLKASEEMIADLLFQISTGQEALADTTIGTQDSLLLRQQMYNWKGQIEAERALIQPILAEKAAESIENAVDLREQNALITVNEQYELNERQVNEIYLATIASEVYTLTASQQTDLLSIAYQCPLAGGQAVYHARGLYAMVSDSIVWNDDSLCTAQGLSFRHTATPTQPKLNKQEIPNISLYPNPAREEVTLVFHHIRDEAQKVVIYDVLGKAVATYLIEAYKENYVLDLHTLSAGVYTLKVGDTYPNTTTHKLIISH